MAVLTVRVRTELNEYCGSSHKKQTNIALIFGSVKETVSEKEGLKKQ